MDEINIEPIFSYEDKLFNLCTILYSIYAKTYVHICTYVYKNIAKKSWKSPSIEIFFEYQILHNLMKLPLTSR